MLELKVSGDIPLNAEGTVLLAVETDFADGKFIKVTLKSAGQILGFKDFTSEEVEKTLKVLSTAQMARLRQL